MDFIIQVAAMSNALNVRVWYYFVYVRVKRNTVACPVKGGGLDCLGVEKTWSQMVASPA
ncbi:MAG: hypothetical protein P8X67_17160 [Syntrophobacterales bacterium]